MELNYAKRKFYLTLSSFVKPKIILFNWFMFKLAKISFILLNQANDSKTYLQFPLIKFCLTKNKFDWNRSSVF